MLTYAISGFTNPFSSEINPDELFCLSSGVPAKPNAVNDLLQAPDIGAKSRDTFIRTRLIELYVGFHERNKLKTSNCCLSNGTQKTYAAKLLNRIIYYFFAENVYSLTSESLPQTCTIIIRSPDTDVFVLLLKYCKGIKTQILFDTGIGNNKNKGEDISSVYPHFTVLQAVTPPMLLSDGDIFFH